MDLELSWAPGVLAGPASLGPAGAWGGAQESRCLGPGVCRPPPAPGRALHTGHLRGFTPGVPERASTGVGGPRGACDSGLITQPSLQGPLL